MIFFTGVLVQLCNPYPRAVSEPAVYEDANVVTVGLTDEEVELLKEKLDPKSSSAAAKKRLNSNNNTASGEAVLGGVPSRSSSMSVSTAQQQQDLSVSYLHV